MRSGFPALQFAKQLQHRFLTLFRRRGKVNFRPAPHVSAQHRVQQRIKFGQGQGTIAIRVVVA
jgi:hypothetical protein